MRKSSNKFISNYINNMYGMGITFEFPMNCIGSLAQPYNSKA